MRSAIVRSCGWLSCTCALAAVSGCGGDDGACQRIIDACHEKDEGSGPAHDCHEFAEADGRTEEECAEKEDSCVSECGQ